MQGADGTSGLEGAASPESQEALSASAMLVPAVWQDDLRWVRRPWWERSLTPQVTPVEAAREA